MKAARDCVLDITVLGAPVGYRPIGGGWWADLAMTVLVCLWILFPQKSGDKLALWRDVGLGWKRGARARARRPRFDRTPPDPRGATDQPPPSPGSQGVRGPAQSLPGAPSVAFRREPEARP
jgi:hypothetical protein